jgi:quercetin dioxygenase-like cupin family protein
MNEPQAAARYRWSELPGDRPMPLLERRRVIGRQMMISQVLLEKGCFVPTHAHENEQFACVLRGRLRFVIGPAGDRAGSEIDVAEGEVLHLPSNVPHSALAVEETLALDLFSPPSATTGIDHPPVPAAAADRRTRGPSRPVPPRGR